MYIVGEDDLSCSSTENADVVHCLIFILFPALHITAFHHNTVDWAFAVQLQLWNHSFSGYQIEETLTAAGKSHLFTRLSYPGAGHLIEPPYSPNARTSLWSVKPRKREFYTRPKFWDYPDLTLYLLQFNCEGDCNMKYVLLYKEIITRCPVLFPLLQSLLYGEVTLHSMLLPRKMPGKKSWNLWKEIWGSKVFFYF